MNPIKKWSYKKAIKILEGTDYPDSVRPYVGKFINHFEYWHYFVLESRIFFGYKLFQIGNALLEFCAVHNILGFKSTVLGEAVQLRIDAKAKVFGVRNGRYVPYKSPRLKFSNYLNRLVHFDAVGFREYVAQT